MILLLVVMSSMNISLHASSDETPIKLVGYEEIDSGSTSDIDISNLMQNYNAMREQAGIYYDSEREFRGSVSILKNRIVS